MPHPDLPAPYRSEAFAEDLPATPAGQPRHTTPVTVRTLLCALPALVALVAAVGLVVAPA